MFIQLGKDRAIKSDAHQYMLCSMQYVKEKVEDSGKVVTAHNSWTPYKYYTTIQKALESVPEQLLKESNAEGWKACKDVLDATREMIREAIDE